MATIKQVAQRANVSVGTVSNVLTGVVPVSAVLREKVLAALRELDYHPDHVARSLKTRQTMTLGMIVSDITNAFFPEVVRGAEDAAWKRHFVLMTLNSDEQPERERQFLSHLRSRRVDGILLVPAAPEGDLSHIVATLESGVPIVCIDRPIATLPMDSVSVDNITGARRAIEHLIACGHRRIGLLTGPLALPVSRGRIEGYRGALESAGIALDENLLRHAGLSAETGYAASLSLLTETRCTAVFSSNAMIALGLLRALHELGLRCPEDVAVATFDDPVYSQALRPELTCVAQPAYDLGYRAVELLFQRLADPSRSIEAIRLDTELRVRRSTAMVQRVAAVT